MFYFSRRVAWYDAYFAPSSVRLVSLTQVQITAWVSGTAHQPTFIQGAVWHEHILGKLEEIF